MDNQPLLNTILHTLYTHYGFSANAIDAVPVGYFEHMQTTEIVYADGERAELFWHRDTEDNDSRLWNFHQLWIRSDPTDDENPITAAVEIGLAVDPGVPGVDALITLFDVFPDIDMEDEIKITDGARWEQFMADHIDAYIDRGDGIVNGAAEEETGDEKTV